ncbi:MAG TPA: HD domain-containing protein [Candidatus Limnocylindria bacterium]|nr:HD domain-containing protein [Candidatus Limnocylindria bacterium]
MRHPLDDVLIAVLPSPADVYAVGGRVRDEFRTRLDGIERPPKDLDYVVTGIPLAALLAALRTAGRVDVVGASFAVLKFRHEAGEADIALPRRERSTGVGHTAFAVESGPEIPLADDLRRRDFRMNMIARRLADDEIVDPYGGVADIRAGRIDIVSEETFEEDPLRMLRAAQFAARFGYALTERTAAAMRTSAALVATVSAERIGEEFGKLLSAATPSAGIEILRAAGVLAEIWPELLEGVEVDQNDWHAYDVYRHNLATLDAAPADDPVLRLAALLHDVGKPRTAAPRPDGRGNTFYQHELVGAELVPAMLARLRLPNETVETVAHLVRHHMYVADPYAQDKTLRRFVRRIGAAHLSRLFALRWADITGSGLPKRDDSNERFEARIAGVLAEAPPFSVRDLAIGGADVLALFERKGFAERGFRGDPRVGEVLRALFEEVTDDPSRNEAGLLVERAERYIDEHFSASR